MPVKKDEPQAIQINTIDDMSRGRYSNSMIIGHGPEEFIMDWLQHKSGTATNYPEYLLAL